MACDLWPDGDVTEGLYSEGLYSYGPGAVTHGPYSDGATFASPFDNSD